MLCRGRMQDLVPLGYEPSLGGKIHNALHLPSGKEDHRIPRSCCSVTWALHPAAIGAPVLSAFPGVPRNFLPRLPSLIAPSALFIIFLAFVMAYIVPKLSGLQTLYKNMKDINIVKDTIVCVMEWFVYECS